MLSIAIDSALTYPPSGDGYSPDEAYPEYRFGTTSRTPNRVYAAVRTCFAQAGLDAANFGTPAWNPLGAFVQPGQQVFVLCNFVFHKRASESQEQFEAKCTHASVVRPVIDYLLIALGGSGRVLFGNSAVQSCDWDAVLRDTGAAELVRFYESAVASVAARDLRMVIAQRDALGQLTYSETRNMARETLSIDLGTTSLLDAVRNDSAPFRVQDYNPDHTESAHAPGRHVYVVHRDVLESDVIFSVPKLKVHEKVGVTCAIKGTVGTIGSKDCLAHHRFGPASRGGDEYPADATGVLRLLSRFHDAIYRRPVVTRWVNYLRVIDRLIRAALRRSIGGVAGAWWGNDTAWRMAVDLARIVECADRDGVMHPQSVRRHIALVDGVVGGDEQGPLNPSRVESGVLLFGDDPVAVDYAAASLMGFDPLRVPLIASLWKNGAAANAIVNGERVPVGQLRSRAPIKFRPPKGWQGKL